LIWPAERHAVDHGLAFCKLAMNDTRTLRAKIEMLSFVLQVILTKRSWKFERAS
jgi:hypothetical protein